MDRRDRILIVSIAILIICIVAVMLVNPVWNPHFSWVSVVVIVSATITTIGLGVFQIFDQLRELKTKRTQEQVPPIRTQEQTLPITVTLQIAGEPVTFNAANIERVEEILRMVQHLRTTDPALAEVKPDTAAVEVPGKSEIEER